MLAKIIFAGSIFLCSSGNALADLQITKTVDGSTVIPAAENDPVRYNLSVTNIGSGNLTNVIIDDVPENLNNLNFTVTSANPPTNGPGPGLNQYRFNNLAAGETVTLDLDATVDTSGAVAGDCPVINNTANVSANSGLPDSATAASIEYDFQFTSGPASNVISHVTATSFCELCDTGEVHIRITNPTTATLEDITLVENLQSLGLTYVNNSTTLNGFSANNPVAPGGGPILTWTPTQIPALASLAAGDTIEIAFRVSTFSEASLLANPNRNIIASATFDIACITGTQTVDSGPFELPLQEPVPQITKRGRNVDGGQNSGNYTPIVYGQEFDDIIWRVDVRNSGLAGLQDLLIADTIGGNFVVNYICPTQAAAETTAITNNGAAPGPGCVAMTSPYGVDDPFGNPPGDEPTTHIDVPPVVGGTPGRAFVYYVGRINASCTAGEFNTADMQWGCEVTSPDGGISATSTGINPPSSSAELSTDNGGGLTINRVMRGIDGGPQIGSNGEVIITITNNSGGTVRGIVLDDLLPVEYVRDTTFAPVLNVNPLHSAYAGMINTITDTNEDTGTLLNNTQPVFALTSSAPARAEPASTNNDNLLRAGDIATITFRIVLVDKPHFDIVANLDIVEEDPASTPANTDPANAFDVDNKLTVNYLDTCTFVAATPLVFDDTFQADIEDLDVTTSAPLYILTNDPLFPVALTVVLTNNGGHDASNYYTYVSFGETIDVQSVPDGCTSIGNPPTPRAVWDNPAAIPATAEVFECTDNNAGLGTITPAQLPVNLTFSVIKNTSAAAIAADDLTFRADVVGVIELFDGTELDVPPPDTATINNTTNNYTLDAIRTRVLGFNLTKTLPGLCTEDASVPDSGDTNLIIGEDCTYHIDAGGWFGFKTPGFTLIEVRDVVVTDDLDDGLGYISHDFTGTDFVAAGGVITSPIVINSPPSSIALSEADINWAFNPLGSGIKVKDQFFRVDITTRLLNDPVDISAAPNVHAAGTFDIGKASFTAVFDTATFNVDETAGIPGYPDESVRRVDLTVTEPSLSVVKEVCNETLSVTKGELCFPFSPTINFNDPDAGDTQDDYVYRVTITNEAASSGFNRAPAYNVAITDQLDVSDLMLIYPGGVAPFDNDGLDNDGDGDADSADADGEFLSLTENIADGGVAASFVISHEHSDVLDRIDPGQSVTFYYRIDPDDKVGPLQILNNTVVDISYDSLDGEFGNQNDPKINNAGTPTSGRARLYNAVNVATASIQILPLDAQPKVINNVSKTAFPTGPPGTPQDVVIGEEILYELRTFIPVANLKDFKIRDELPAGIRCIQAQNIDLNAAPYNTAGFRTNGLVNTVTFPATCDPTGASNVVEWSFGNQELTTANNNNLFEFTAWFIARVDNIAANINDVDIINGGASTVVTTSYINDSNVLVTLPHDSVAIKIKEPQIELTKRFTDALGTDIDAADAGDIVTITVTARNAGTATAYNLQILDDLDLPADTRLTYVGNETGVVPDNIDLITLGANRPVFNWDNPASAAYALDVGEQISFTFQVQVELDAQPLEILNNTIQSSWTSLPSINTVLNTTTGSIGADGAIDGMRNGSLPNVSDAINNYESNAVDQVEVPMLALDKTDLDPAITTLPVGAHKRFQIDIDLPEGTTHDVVLTDNLAFPDAFPGLSYVLENDAVIDVSYNITGIATINNQPPGEAAFNSFPADESSGVVIWDIGKVVTQSEDDLTASAISPRIRITYYARVNNDLDTNVGSTLQNSATLNYQNGETLAPAVALTDTTAPITVIEPLLTVGKVLSNVTPGKAAADLPDAGDLIQYVITVENIGDSIAYDVNLVDTLPADLQWDASLIAMPTATINAGVVADFVSTPGGQPVGPLVWGRDNGDENLDIPIGGTLIITYQAVVQDTSEANRQLSNSVVVDWTSLNGVNADERTGSNVPDFNDYFTLPAAATTTVIDNNNITKASNNDSYLDTGNVRIGDTVDYTLTLRLQEGTTRAISLVDTLPNGLEFVSILSVNGDSVAPYTSAGVFAHADINAPIVTIGPGNNTISWILGNAATGIVNAADNNAANDNFVIVYRAQVVNDELVMPQVASSDLINNAVLEYQDSNNAVVSLSDNETIVAQQPIIFTADLSKVRRNGLPSGNAVASGEIMDFRLSACNSGDAPAYDLILEDLLPAELDETTIVPPVVTINGGLAVVGVDYTYIPPVGVAGTMRFLFNNEAKPVNPGQCAVIDFDISVRTPIGIGQTFENNFQAIEYHSLDSDNPNQLERETYALSSALPFLMNTVIGVIPPDKSLVSPLNHEATIGEIITYQIKVPGDSGSMSVDLFETLISDDMASNLTFVDATLDAGSTYVGAFDTSTSVANQVRIEIALLPVMAGTTQQAVFNIRARVNNDANTNALLPVPTPAFGNTVSYTFADSPGGVAINGGFAATPGVDDISIVEPVVTLVSKTVVNQDQANALTDAGDTLRYTLVINAAAGATESDAFDISVIDNLSLGLVYLGNPTVTPAGGNVIVAPTISGDGVATAQTLNWNLANGTNIDIPEGGTVTITYDVKVLDSVLALQNLTNSAQLQWTSLDGVSIGERDGSNVLVYNDYFSAIQSTTVTTPDTNLVNKTRLIDTFESVAPPGDNIVRIGDIVDYELRINLQEGTHTNTIISDSLPQGMVFEQTVSINGDIAAPYTATAPFSHSDIAAATVVGDPATGQTVTWNAGNVINAGDNNIPIANDDFVIVYRARVLNLVHPQQDNIALSNDVSVNYGAAAGPAPAKLDSETLDLQQPNLSIAKVQVFTPTSLDSTIDAGEVVRYMVSITNNGTAPAYDTELRDIIPLGLRSPAVTVINTRLAVAGTDLPDLAPAYNPVTGIAIWNFDSGNPNQYNIPALDTLELVYEVQADAGLGTGLTMTNSAQVQLYYSFDNNDVPTSGVATGVREIYGPSNIAQVALDTLPASALLKTNPADLEASIGETFSYRITVPGVIQPTALYDVRIFDDLVNDSAADLQFVSVTKVIGSQPWTPANDGTVDDNLIIADAAIGIDIPANEQAIIDVTVTLRNADPPNVAGLLFNNTATYTFNQIDNNVATQANGVASTTVDDMTVVEPELTMDKSGPAGTVNFAVPIPYRLVVENTGTGPAFDTTIIDKLPDVSDNPPLTGGTCDTAPANVIAYIAKDATEAVPERALSIVDGDYVVAHTAAPVCEFVITTLSDKARIEFDEKLIVTYDVSLDPASQSSASLTNIAGVTQWFSLDTAGAGATGQIREYTRTITTGTPAVTDHEDAATVIVEAPVLDVQKTVMNVTTGQIAMPPPDNSIASPGDTLRYTITINNGGIIDASGVTVSDAIPANATYVADSVTLNGLPVAQPDAGVSPLIAGIDVSSSDLTPPLPGVGNGIITVGQTATVTFDVLLDPVINSGTIITNQALLDSPSTGVLLSDDPNINGNDDPVTIGDEDPTQTLITSAPAFQVQKTSLDITGDPALLQAGDTLRYTITVKNIGQENAVNALLSDQIPANTIYAANSTTLNGVVIADPVAGISALAAGMLINAPENTTAGFMRADTDVAANNVAVITFDVVINSSAVIGTVISNQGFVNGDGAGSGVFPQQPSDDPGTAAVDDPTLDIVGNVPLFDVQKTVAIVVDGTTPGIVDPGDVLRYTITTTNMGAIPITNVVLIDALPLNTTYVPNSVLLNNLPVGQPDGGILPLEVGIDISSSDLTPPLPLAGAGTLTPGQAAVVTFDVTVNVGTPANTIISNQGLVSSNELPDEPTDVDGIDTNGDQPTIVTVGSAPLISIIKQVNVVGGGAALAGGQLEYIVRVVNTGIVPVTNVVITDDLVDAQMTYVPGSGLLNGLPAGVSFDIPTTTLTADLSLTPALGILAPAGIVELRFRVSLAATLNIGDIVSNLGEVTWNVPPTTASASVDISIGGTPGAANLSGLAWHDADFDDAKAANEVSLTDWRVELYQNNVLLGNAQTDANGVFSFSGLPPNLPAGIAYEVRYLAPGATATTASLGQTSSAFTDGPQIITDIFSASGAIIQNLNLPRQPNGIVYDSVQRVPVAGTRLTMINQTRSNQQLSTNCFTDAKQQNQVTLADGYYKFDLKFGESTCVQGDEYVVQMQPPANGFVGNTSVIIPPVVPITGIAKDVPGCLSDGTDKIPATALHCENSASAIQPPDSVEPRTSGTDYNLKFLFNDAPVPSTNQIFNNHIPVDPKLEQAVAISKVAGLQNVTRSQLVPYTITLNNTLSVRLSDLNVIDNFPAGFKYVTGSSRIDGVEVEPLINGRQLTWPNLDVEVNESRVIKLLLVVGSGVGEGEYVNTARIINSRTGEPFSGVASATVQVIPDPTFDCTDIIGKVYDDANNNAYQDQGEKGLPGVQVATARGLRVTTDAHGRFHITCAVVPNEVRGSNFIMKLDDRTLPSGYRMTTENPRVQRATRGKMLKFNFGATVHRVVRLDLADGVFEKGSTELRPQWRSRIDMLITELEKDPSILRLSYLGENETESEVDDRLDAIEELISDRWQELDCCYKLTIESEVFWRKGSPSERKRFE